MPREIEIENLGPVKSLVIPLPAGGVVVLKGDNGSGKSTVLTGVGKLLGGRAAGLSAHDGAKRGTVAIGEAVLSVTRSKAQARGELEITGLESRLDVAALVDPGIANRETADAYRLKALVALAGVEAKPESFWPLVGGEAAYAALGIDDAVNGDVLLLAARVKRKIEANARTAELSAEEWKTKADSLAKMIADVDLDSPTDEEQLADEYARARSHVDGMKQHNQQAAEAAASAKVAAEQLAALAEDSDSAAALQTEIERLNDESDAMEIERTVAENLALELKRKMTVNDETVRNLNARKVSAMRAAAQRDRLAQDAAAAVPGQHTDEALAAAQAAAEAAHAGILKGAEVRKAKAIQAEEEQARETMKAQARESRLLRERAASIDGVLSDMLPAGCPLRYEAGRLVLKTDRSQSEPFSELSDGERWRIAIDFGADQLSDNGLLCIPQVGWEGLAPKLQAEIDEHAKARGVVILTAAVDDGQLRAEGVANG